MASLTLDSKDVVLRSMRGSPPTHYIVKVQTFSLLAKNTIEKYELGDFEVGGYKWKLVLYPNGNKSKNVKEHISLYLAMADTSSLQFGWEVNAVFQLFLLDQNTDTYLTLQDALGKVRRFHGLKLKWGFDQFIPLETFNDAGNGYLVDDTCVFGVEVFVKERCTGKGECISMIKDPIKSNHVWRIENFSKLDSEYHDSKSFIAGDQKWKILVYPKGKGPGMGSHLSLYLALADPTTLPAGSKIFAEFTLRLVDHLYPSWNITFKATNWFSAHTPENGWARFILLTSFLPPSNGFLVKDTCIVEAEVTVHGITNMNNKKAAANQSMLLCCKLFISESRNHTVLDSIERAARLDTETVIVNKFPDLAYNRVRYTLVSYVVLNSTGRPIYSPLQQTVLAMVEAAYGAINLEFHSGAHPRLGVVDDIVFHPLARATLNEAAWLAKAVAADIGNRFQAPVFLYAAAHPTGKALETIRREFGFFQPNIMGNQWAGWTMPDSLTIKPDEGPTQVSRARGITMVGARPWVGLYNVPIMSKDVSVARRIARMVSARGGGLPTVQTVGLVHEDSTEVACMLLEPNLIGADKVQARVEMLAAQEGLNAEKGYFTDFSQEMTLEKYMNLIPAN